jgi:hypothetical protein
MLLPYMVVDPVLQAPEISRRTNPLFLVHVMVPVGSVKTCTMMPDYAIQGMNLTFAAKGIMPDSATQCKDVPQPLKLIRNQQVIGSSPIVGSI